MSLLPASEKEALLAQRMSNLGVQETDLEETPVGAGGPKAQRMSIGVVLLHRPSGLRIKCQATPDKLQNRLIALRLLLDKVEVWQKNARSERYFMKRAVSLVLAILAMAVAALVYYFFVNRGAFHP
jgi:protein subunit release factor A